MPDNKNIMANLRTSQFDRCPVAVILELYSKLILKSHQLSVQWAVHMWKHRYRVQNHDSMTNNKRVMVTQRKYDCIGGHIGFFLMTPGEMLHTLWKMLPWVIRNWYQVQTKFILTFHLKWNFTFFPPDY